MAAVKTDAHKAGVVVRRDKKIRANSGATDLKKKAWEKPSE